MNEALTKSEPSESSLLARDAGLAQDRRRMPLSRILLCPPLLCLYGSSLICLFPSWCLGAGPGAVPVLLVAGVLLLSLLFYSPWQKLVATLPLLRPAGAACLAFLVLLGSYPWARISGMVSSPSYVSWCVWALHAALIGLLSGACLSSLRARNRKGIIAATSLKELLLLALGLLFVLWAARAFGRLVVWFSPPSGWFRLRYFPAEKWQNFLVIVATAAGLWLLLGALLLSWPRCSRFRKWRYATCASLLGACLLYVLLEGLFRLAGNGGYNLCEVFDRKYLEGPVTEAGAYVWRGNFGSRREFINLVRLNSRGWHDVEHRREKPAGTFRVALVGDSFVEARQVPLKNTVARRLEMLCRGQVEVGAFGKSGIGTAEMARIIRRDVMTFQPDLILVEFLAMNDVRDNSVALTRRQKHETRHRFLNGKIGRLTRFYKLQFLAFLIFQADRFCDSLRLKRALPVDYGVFLPEQYDADWKDAWARTEAAFTDIFCYCRSRSVRVGVAVFSHPFLIGAYANETNRALQTALEHYAAEGLILDFKYPDHRIESFCQQQGVPFSNLSLEFARLPVTIRESLHFKSDSHWTAQGHQEAARVLSKMVDSITPPN